MMQVFEYKRYVLHPSSILWWSLDENIGELQYVQLQLSVEWPQFLLKIYEGHKLLLENTHNEYDAKEHQNTHEHTQPL